MSQCRPDDDSASGHGAATRTQQAESRRARMDNRSTVSATPAVHRMLSRPLTYEDAGGSAVTGSVDIEGGGEGSESDEEVSGKPYMHAPNGGRGKLSLERAIAEQNDPSMRVR